MERKPPMPLRGGPPPVPRQRSEASRLSFERNSSPRSSVSSSSERSRVHIKAEVASSDIDALLEMMQSRKLSDPRKNQIHQNWIETRLKEADRAVGKIAILTLSGMLAWETGAHFFHQASLSHVSEAFSALGSFMVSGTFLTLAAREMKKEFDKHAERAKALFKKNRYDSH